jgi:Protein of unknown function (DUF3769)
MPYPVLPPTPPPIVQFQPPEEPTPSVPSAIAPPDAQSAPEFTARSLGQPLSIEQSTIEPAAPNRSAIRIALPPEAIAQSTVAQSSEPPTAPSVPPVPSIPPDLVVPTVPQPESLPLPSPTLPSNEVLPDEAPPVAPPEIPQIPPEAPPAPAPSAPETPATPRPPVPGAENIIELNADRQIYDERDQVYRALGNAVLRFRGAVLRAARIQVNVPNRIVVAEGDAVLTRGQQVIKGDRLEYNLVQGEGTVLGASGELDLPSAGSDFSSALPTDESAPRPPSQSPGDRVTAAQPLQVTGATPGVTFGLSSGNARNAPETGATGEVRRLRFEAEQIDFTAEGWEASNVRITNDPFSPPELELRSNRVTFTRLSPTRSEIRARRPRVVFDQGFSLPLLRDRLVLDSSNRDSGLAQFGFDQEERGGFFVERTFEVVSTPVFNFSLTPQILLQRSFDQRDFLSADSFGLTARMNANLSPGTSVLGNASFNSLDFNDLENSLRASLRARQRIGNHALTLEYTYRDRLFNGSLGFQNVQSSLGFVVTSPVYTLGQTGINLSYQGGVQYINANTDRPELLEISRENNRVDLTRYQASASLSRPFLIWSGQPLPATPTEGLRYSPTPIVPYIAIAPGVTGTFSGYSSGDTQSAVTGSVTLYGQFGHFSKPVFDYTGFNVTYSYRALDGRSPFLFDRVADEQVLSAGITQQVYGPFRVGVQTAFNLDTGREIDTTFTLEYKRRAYSLAVSYSPIREAAALTLQISDFNWTGEPGRFSGLGAESVEGGVRTRN